MVMQRFYLVRKEDVSGISGNGVVAEGVRMGDGAIALRWLTGWATWELLPDLESMEAIHGHGGKTVVEWVDR